MTSARFSPTGAELADGELLERFTGRAVDDSAAERAFAALVSRHGPMAADARQRQELQ
jgi:hypothetical protein